VNLPSCRTKEDTSGQHKASRKGRELAKVAVKKQVSQAPTHAEITDRSYKTRKLSGKARYGIRITFRTKSLDFCYTRSPGRRVYYYRAQGNTEK